MAKVILQLDPARLNNPDADLRYDLPRLLEKHLNGKVKDDGYDYVTTDTGATLMLVFLETDDPSKSASGVVQFLECERVRDNDLSQVPVAIERGGKLIVVHPRNYSGHFYGNPHS